ncbi:MAG: 2-C-methyl-D-erythritol 4-phosphate cytidylyltransferase [Dissulfurispiraceae bacterium]|jgi:2-C-methyl-D-erythritol 4-phosphate cytidylyltransferase|nr:2-C-methyl-D-erythritol 4-phosphate cytidylyltransferase [Dissulfurispiraceae bacterium]
MRIAAIVPAAGIGRRFGNERKPFIYLGGRPLLVWVLDALQNAKEIDEIIPVVREEELLSCADLVDEYKITKARSIVPGGRERQDSVYNALRSVDSDVSTVVVHDGVRPFADTAFISKCIAALDRDSVDGVIPAVIPKDTIKIIEPGSFLVSSTFERSLLRAVQTPQVFRADTLLKAYDYAAAKDIYATDDAALVERMGGRVKIIEGSYKNIKVTTPEDIDIAEMILSRGLQA